MAHCTAGECYVEFVRRFRMSAMLSAARLNAVVTSQHHRVHLGTSILPIKLVWISYLGLALLGTARSRTLVAALQQRSACSCAQENSAQHTSCTKAPSFTLRRTQ